MKFSISINKEGVTKKIEGEDINQIADEVAKLGGLKEELIKGLSNEIKLKYENFDKHYREAILNKYTGYWNEIEEEKLKLIEDVPRQELLSKPPEPDRKDSRYKIEKKLSHIFAPSKKKKIISEMEKLYQTDLSVWRNRCLQIERENLNTIKLFNERQSDRLKTIEAVKNSIESTKRLFLSGDPETVVKVLKDFLIKSRFNYIESQHEPQVEFFKDTGLIALDYFLPSFEDVYEVRELKFISRRNKADEIKTIRFSKSERKQLYNDLCLKITLRVIYSIFSLGIDSNNFTSVVFNGYLDTIDKATGLRICPCIITISVKKEEIIKYNLTNVDPKECFRKLGGICAAELSNVTPLAPIIQLNKVDKRFINGYDIIKGINDTTNLATMEWEDFEHLIREIFEREFMSNGAEVRVTQASRDGGVDAVIFDPDPIRGGKIVIQAKRYTNVVGVSAVRDLYGTLMNEGATKGILVTTSNYGSDAYEFAKGKPITLLNGANLLHLLEKHGYKAKIDLIEAKKRLKSDGQ